MKNTYSIKTNTAKYSNMHSIDPKDWKFTCDFSVPQDSETLTEAQHHTLDLLVRICSTNVFKPEDVQDARDLIDFISEQTNLHFAGGKCDKALATFIVYQFQRYAYRIWYGESEKARNRVMAFTGPTKFEPLKKPTLDMTAPLTVSKLTKAQKKELVMALLAELLS